MPALNYQKQFAPKVEARLKRQTIRATRKVPFKVGDTLYHYTGMRTSKCQKLAETKCRTVSDISIRHLPGGYCLVYLNDAGYIQDTEVVKIARADGFGSIEAFRDFFAPKVGDVFTGQLITW